MITRITPMDITAAGIEADTVSPTLSPRYAFAPPKMMDIKMPRMMEVAVISGRVESAGTNGLNLPLSSLIIYSPFLDSRPSLSILCFNSINQTQFYCTRPPPPRQ